MNDKLGSATIDISSPCARTHLWLVAGRQYRVRIEPGIAESAPGTFEKKPEYAWFDKGMPADLAGVDAHSLRHFAAMTLKHWWRENYFQPIARRQHRQLRIPAQPGCTASESGLLTLSKHHAIGLAG